MHGFFLPSRPASLPPVSQHTTNCQIERIAGICLACCSFLQTKQLTCHTRQSGAPCIFNFYLIGGVFTIIIKQANLIGGVFTIAFPMSISPRALATSQSAIRRANHASISQSISQMGLCVRRLTGASRYGCGAA